MIETPLHKAGRCLLTTFISSLPPDRGMNDISLFVYRLPLTLGGIVNCSLSVEWATTDTLHLKIFHQVL